MVASLLDDHTEADISGEADSKLHLGSGNVYGIEDVGEVGVVRVLGGCSWLRCL